MRDQHSHVLKHKLTLVVLGRSGSGKGTQARFIVERLKRFGGEHVSTGELLRDFMRGSGPAAQVARRVMKRGGLHPSWLAAYLWLKAIIAEGGGRRHLVFDGACRRIFEAKLLDDVMTWYDRPLPVCVYIDVSRAEAERRLLARGRGDDTASAIKRRLDYFPKEVVPVLHYYEKQGRMIRVNGQQPPEIVFRDIDAALRKKLGTSWPSPSKPKRK